MSIAELWGAGTAWIAGHPGWVLGGLLALLGWQVVSGLAYPSRSREDRGISATLLALVETGLVTYDHEAQRWMVADRLGRSEPVPEVMAEVMREHGSGVSFARQYDSTTHDPVKLTDEGHEELVHERRLGRPGRVERVREMWP